ncbi:MAG TPA: MarR family transcriptional regulator [Conexibacter sp.]|nr:MarR family transcriptional regulator [Conexibacter sp.]
MAPRRSSRPPSALPLPLVGAGGSPDGVDPSVTETSREFYEKLNIGFLVSFAFRAMLDQHHTLLSTHGVRDFRAAHGYILLAVQGEGITLTDLVAQTQISKQAISPLVRELEEQGLVRRTPDPGDRRRLRIQLTEQGDGVLRAAVQCWQEIAEGFVDLVGETAFASLKQTFVEYLAAYSPLEEGRRPKPRPIW